MYDTSARSQPPTLDLRGCKGPWAIRNKTLEIYNCDIFFCNDLQSMSATLVQSSRRALLLASVDLPEQSDVMHDARRCYRTANPRRCCLLLVPGSTAVTR
eukprot:scaffold76540_cov29-Prasinocladus_malaysianus.AAC.3